MMEDALRYALLLNHELAIQKIIDYVTHHVMVITIDESHLRNIILNKNSKVMRLLVTNKIQLQRILKNGVKATSTIEMGSFIHSAFKLEEVSEQDLV